MLHSMKVMRGYAIRALDGDAGRVDDFYFDDRRWMVCHLVVQTGNWLTGRKVVLDPCDLCEPGPNAGVLPVALTSAQVERSPYFGQYPPVSQQRATEVIARHGWPGSWIEAEKSYVSSLGVGGGLTLREAAEFPPAGEAMHGEIMLEDPTEHTPFGAMLPQQHGDPHLRSVREVSGYSLHSHEGECGSVKDFLVDDATWSVTYLVVRTGGWLTGRKVLLPPESINGIDWALAKVHTDLPRELIHNGPAFDLADTISRKSVKRLYRISDRYSRPILNSKHRRRDDFACPGSGFLLSRNQLRRTRSQL